MMRRLSTVAAGVFGCLTVALFVWGLRTGDWRLIGFGLGSFIVAGGGLIAALGPVIRQGD